MITYDVTEVRKGSNLVYRDVATGDVVAELDTHSGKLSMRMTLHVEPEPESELFDPGDYTVSEVVSYMASQDVAESERVREAERAGRARKTILNY